MGVMRSVVSLMVGLSVLIDVQKVSDRMLTVMCEKPGHTRQYCLEKKTQDTNMCYTPRPHTRHTQNSTGHSVQVLVNGEAAKALVDAGSSQTLVHQSLVPLEECRVQPSCLRKWCWDMIYPFYVI